MKPRKADKPLIFPAGASVTYSEPGLEYRVYVSGQAYRKRLGEAWEQIDGTEIPDEILTRLQDSVREKMAGITSQVRH